MPATQTPKNIDQKTAEFMQYLYEKYGSDGARDFIQGLADAMATETYTAIMYFLEEEDLDYIDKLTDEKEAEAEIKKRFKKRSGMTVEEFITQVKESYTELFPEDLLD